VSVGSQPSQGNINQTLTSLALALREMSTDILEQWAYLNKEGLTGLDGLGFSAADAGLVLTMIDYMATVAQVYKGTVQAQGSGGTGAIMFNFEDALTPLWGGS
jgi:hypothetical protein